MFYVHFYPTCFFSKNLTHAEEAIAIGKKLNYRKQFQSGQIRGHSVLEFAVRNDHSLLCNLLIEELHVDPNTVQDGLMSSVQPLDPTVILFFIIEIQIVFCYYFLLNAERTCVHHAAQRGQIKVLEDLVAKYKADINEKDICGSTPLHTSVLFGKLLA